MLKSSQKSDLDGHNKKVGSLDIQIQELLDENDLLQKSNKNSTVTINKIENTQEKETLESSSI
jgi:hypothetical protein